MGLRFVPLDGPRLGETGGGELVLRRIDQVANALAGVWPEGIEEDCGRRLEASCRAHEPFGYE